MCRYTAALDNFHFFFFAVWRALMTCCSYIMHAMLIHKFNTLWFYILFEIENFRIYNTISASFYNFKMEMIWLQIFYRRLIAAKFIVYIINQSDCLKRKIDIMAKKNDLALTESLDICMPRIGLFNCIVFSRLKLSNDHKHTVASWLDDTKTSLAVLTNTDVTGPRWWSIFCICLKSIKLFNIAIIWLKRQI